MSLANQLFVFEDTSFFFYFDVYGLKGNVLDTQL